MSKSLDSDQARHFFAPDLGPDFSQRLSADESLMLAAKKRVKWVFI